MINEITNSENDQISLFTDNSTRKQWFLVHSAIRIYVSMYIIRVDIAWDRLRQSLQKLLTVS